MLAKGTIYTRCLTNPGKTKGFRSPTINFPISLFGVSNTKKGSDLVAGQPNTLISQRIRKFMHTSKRASPIAGTHHMCKVAPFVSVTPPHLEVSGGCSPKFGRFPNLVDRGGGHWPEVEGLGRRVLLRVQDHARLAGKGKAPREVAYRR